MHNLSSCNTGESCSLLPVYTANDGCEVYSCLSYRPASPSDSLRLANQEQVRGSCVSFDSLGAVGSSSCRLCVSFDSLGAVGSSSCRLCVSFESLGAVGPFCRGSWLKPRQKVSPYIYVSSPFQSSLFFSLGGRHKCVLVFFSSYALEVFDEMPERAMTLEFTLDKHDMRC